MAKIVEITVPVQLSGSITYQMPAERYESLNVEQLQAEAKERVSGVQNQLDSQGGFDGSPSGTLYITIDEVEVSEMGVEVL